MHHKTWFLLLSILHCTYAATTTSKPTTARPTARPTVLPTVLPTLAPSVPTTPPTHGPTKIPTSYPTFSPTVALQSNQQIRIEASVSMSGEELSDLCDTKLDQYHASLSNAFAAASGVDNSDIDETEIKDCNQDNTNVVLGYEMRSDNSRAKNTFSQRVSSGEFLSEYQAQIDLIFSSVVVSSVQSVSIDVARKKESSRDAFAHFFSGYFGLGVVILAVSILWFFLLRADEQDTYKRLQQLQEEKRQFEEKYGTIEEDSTEITSKMVEMVDNTKVETQS